MRAIGFDKALLLLVGLLLSPSSNDYSRDDFWLCRPGRQDACAVDLSATLVTAERGANLRPRYETVRLLHSQRFAQTSMCWSEARVHRDGLFETFDGPCNRIASPKCQNAPLYT